MPTAAGMGRGMKVWSVLQQQQNELGTSKRDGRSKAEAEV